MSRISYTIRDLSSTADYQACVALQRLIWGAEFSEIVPVTMIKLTQRLGGVAAGAFSPDQQLLGFVFSMSGLENGQPIHWSDILGVRPAARDQGIGEALKRHQRQKLLATPVQRVYWTFDPLESRNAHVNFNRLGVISREYVRDAYSTSDSPLHLGIGTDRLVVLWQINSTRVAERLAGTRLEPARWDQTPLANPVERVDNILISQAPSLELTAAAISVAIPPDIQQLKTAALEHALAWRTHTRAAFEHYLAREYVVTEFLRGAEFGRYVLERRPLLA